MARSEKVAAAVALQKAGFNVAVTDQGALIEAVASDGPAASKLRSGDVILTANGEKTLTPLQLRTAFTSIHPGDKVVLRVRRDGVLRTVTVKTVSDAGRAIVGIYIAQRQTSSCP
jgi:PDZ domain-containing protein